MSVLQTATEEHVVLEVDLVEGGRSSTPLVVEANYIALQFLIIIYGGQTYAIHCHVHLGSILCGAVLVEHDIEHQLRYVEPLSRLVGVGAVSLHAHHSVCGIKHGPGVFAQILEPLGADGIAIIEDVAGFTACQLLFGDDSTLSALGGEHMLHDSFEVTYQIVLAILVVETGNIAVGPAVGEYTHCTATPAADGSTLATACHSTCHVTVGDV